MTEHNVELVYNSKATELINRNQYTNGGWLHSPAQLELFARSIKFLIKLNRARGIDANWVPYVRAARLKGEDIVYVWPTDEKDEDKIEVRPRSAHAWINIRSLLEPSFHTVEQGYRVRYEIVADDKSPVGPALKFDLSKPLERKRQPPSKQGKSGKAKAAPAQPQDTTTQPPQDTTTQPPQDTTTQPPQDNTTQQPQGTTT